MGVVKVYMWVAIAQVLTCHFTFHSGNSDTEMNRITLPDIFLTPGIRE
jgi:hypothetical protein